MNISETAHSRQHAIAAKPAAVLVLAGAGYHGDPSDLLDMTKPGVRAYWTVEAGCLDDFEREPMLNAYIKNGVPVVVAFESEADADECARRMGKAVSE